jgi:hypothetical protein
VSSAAGTNRVSSAIQLPSGDPLRSLLLTPEESLAWVVLKGHTDATGPLADLVFETWNVARAESLRAAE